MSRASSVAALVDRAVDQERMVAQVSGFFGILALLLAAIGLYGVLAYAIARRTQEMGIRMALGAERSRILRGVMVETFTLVIVGIAIGVPAALACGRLVRTTLYGLAVLDPLTVAASITILCAAAAVAGYLPARRASRVDPIVALRCE